MDAITDMDTVDEKKSNRPKPKQKPRSAKIPIKMPSKQETNADSELDTLSDLPKPDVQGQLYLFDQSEEPNVVMRLSNLEEFIYKLLTDKAGVMENTYLAILVHFGPLVSQRFKNDVMSNVKKDDGVYRFTPPKFTGPAAQEIYS